MRSLLQAMLEVCFNNLHPEKKTGPAEIDRIPTPAELRTIERRKKRIREAGKKRQHKPTEASRARGRRNTAAYRARRAHDAAAREKRNADQRAWNRSEAGQRSAQAAAAANFLQSKRARARSRELAANLCTLGLRDLEAPRYRIRRNGRTITEKWPLQDEASRWLAAHHPQGRGHQLPQVSTIAVDTTTTPEYKGTMDTARAASDHNPADRKLIASAGARTGTSQNRGEPESGVLKVST